MQYDLLGLALLFVVHQLLLDLVLLLEARLERRLGIGQDLRVVHLRALLPKLEVLLGAQSTRRKENEREPRYGGEHALSSLTMIWY